MKQLKSVYYPSYRNIAYRQMSGGEISRQRGAVLITVLIMLVIMTLLGLSTMTSSTLQERMAGNSQEVSRSFHLAESALSAAFDDSNSLDTSGNVTINLNDGNWGNFGNIITAVQYTARFRGTSALGRNQNLAQVWGSNFGRYNFDIQSTGTTASGVNTVLNGGVAQIGPLQQ